MSYRIKVRRKGYRSISRTFQRLTDARTFARQVEADIEGGRALASIEARRHTLLEAIDRYCETHLVAKARHTQKNQLIQLKWWRSEIGHLRLNDVTAAILSEQRDKLLKRYSSATARVYLAAIGSVLRVCCLEWEWMDANPLTRVQKPSGSPQRTRFLSDDERQRLLEKCRESNCTPLYLVVVLALSSGGRKGEILGLKWLDVDLQNGALTFRDTKNKDTRRVAIGGQALEALREYAKVRKLHDDRVFPPRLGARRLSIDEPFREAVDAAGIENFRFHDLRHTTASILAMRGVSLAEIGAVLGHRSISMTLRYSHLTQTHVDGVLREMNEQIFT